MDIEQGRKQAESILADIISGVESGYNSEEELKKLGYAIIDTCQQQQRDFNAVSQAIAKFMHVIESFKAISEERQEVDIQEFRKVIDETGIKAFIDALRPIMDF